jgi:hypothetical protein
MATLFLAKHMATRKMEYVCLKARGMYLKIHWYVADYFFCRFVGTQGANESNMAVMEVTLPSGFTVDSDALPSLRMSQNVKRVETKNGDTVVVLYFDKV